MANKETVVTLFDDGRMEVVTTNRKWVNRMEKLVDEGHAEPFESDLVGQAYEADASLLRIPFYRKSRTYTAAEKKATAERLAAGREEKSKPKTKAKRGVAAKK